MKHKKKLLYVFIVCFLVAFTLVFTMFIKNNKSDKLNVLLGNKVEIEQIQLNDTFTSDFMDSNYLKELLINDASKQIDGKIVKLSNLIKNSKNVYINIGSIDLNTLIEQDNINNKLNYDLQLIERKLEIYFANINIIKEKIIDINKKTNICFISLSYPYSINDDNIKEIYEKINEKLIKL